MSISRPSMRKFLREHFTGGEALHLDKSEQEKLVATLRQRFKDDAWVDVIPGTSRYRPNHERYLLELYLQDPQVGYTYSSDLARLLVDDDGALEIEAAGESTPVSSLDEVLSFIRECKRRFERQRAQRKRREKVSMFKNTAMIAQLKQVARQEKFDFATDFTPQRVKVWIRLNETRVLEILILRKRFQETLPRLGNVIRSLRECWELDLSFRTATEQSLPWGAEWVVCSGSKDQGDSP